jgi:3-hydroxy-3-methylglutaryl CoA synthase/uncharacterized OB-fold protein
VTGILGYAAYVPHFRLQRKTIGAQMLTFGKGARAVASFDEDATSMAVEAARRLPRWVVPTSVVLATARPPYLEKTNATAVHAALGLPSSVGAYDAIGSVRSGVHALRQGLAGSTPSLALLSDVRVGMPGGGDESNGGDAAAAFLVGAGAPVLAELIGTGSATAEFLDRWRLPEESTARVWEERFGEVQYLPLADAAWADALKAATLTPGDVDHLVVAGTHNRANKAFARGAGVRPDALADDLTAVLGNTGVAHPGLLLADALDRADAGQVIALVVLADGVDVLLWRTTDALVHGRTAATVAEQVAAGDDRLGYATYLTWRGTIDREPPRRPDPAGPAAPVTARNDAWKFQLIASRCTDCGTAHLPPGRVCMSCGATDHMEDTALADVGATVKTFSIDRLAFHPSPPLIVVIVDFDGGGRATFELTDADPTTVVEGMRVRMSFRRTVTAAGIHNYWWKAVPVSVLPEGAESGAERPAQGQKAESGVAR